MARDLASLRTRRATDLISAQRSKRTISRLKTRRALVARVPTMVPAMRAVAQVVKEKNTTVKRTKKRMTMTRTTSTTGTRRKRNKKATRKMWLANHQQSKQGCRRKLTETCGTVTPDKAMENRCIKTKIARCSKIRRSTMRRTKKTTRMKTKMTTKMKTSTTRTRTTWTS